MPTRRTRPLDALTYIDALLPLGRTNRSLPDAPRDEAEALALMDRLDVAEALVVHTRARDGDFASGNAPLDGLTSPRLHRIFAFEPAAIERQSVDAFLQDALRRQARAILVNPAARGVRVSRSPRVGELAARLEARRIPLVLAYAACNLGEDMADWYDMADLCQAYPRLPVLAWQFRTRANRPLFDAMAAAGNLIPILSTLWQAQSLEAIHDRFGAGRVVFSLGLPHLHAASFPMVVRYAAIPPAAQEAVAAGTVRALLKEADYAA